MDIDGVCDVCYNDKRDIDDSCKCKLGYFEESDNSTSLCGDCIAIFPYCK